MPQLSLNACTVILSVLPNMDLILFPTCRFISDLRLLSLLLNGHVYNRHIISNDCDDADDILTKKLSFIGQANKVLYNFRNVDCVTKTKLVNVYCTSFYGAEIWDLSHRDIELVCTAWRKGLRRIWQIPRTTRSVLLPLLSNTKPLIDMFYKRMLNFVHDL